MDSQIEWTYNRFGHVLLTEIDTKKEIYMQIDYDVESFFNQIGLNMDQIDIGDHDICDNPGYEFNE